MTQETAVSLTVAIAVVGVMLVLLQVWLFRDQRKHAPSKPPGDVEALGESIEELRLALAEVAEVSEVVRALGTARLPARRTPASVRELHPLSNLEHRDPDWYKQISSAWSGISDASDGNRGSKLSQQTNVELRRYMRELPVAGVHDRGAPDVMA